MDKKIKISYSKMTKKISSLSFEDSEYYSIYGTLFIHNINTVLQNIKSSAELSYIFLDKNHPDCFNKIKEMMDIINTQVLRGKKLVTNIYKISELDKDQKKLKVIEIHEVLNNSVNYVKSAFQDSTININLKSQYNEIFIKANNFLPDVFENILFNGLRHNNNPIIEILIKLSKELNNGIQYLKIEFLDNGIGITDSQKKLIFQNGQTKHKYAKGMGVGLSLVKKIIEMYNGQIRVEDRIKGDYSKGSNFILLIPLVERQSS